MKFEEQLPIVFVQGKKLVGVLADHEHVPQEDEEKGRDSVPPLFPFDPKDIEWISHLSTIGCHI